MLLNYITLPLFVFAGGERKLNFLVQVLKNWT